MFTGGTAMPQIVMPIVFGTAVTVSAFVALRSAENVSPWLPVGIAVIAIGIVLVAYNTPHAAPQGSSAAASKAQD